MPKIGSLYSIFRLMLLIYCIGDCYGCSISQITSNSATASRPNNIVSEERIVFGSDSKLFSIRPDGTDEKLIQDNIITYTVSPNSKWLLAFDDTDRQISKFRIYDLQRGVVSSKTLPDGAWVWNDMWWSVDSNKLFFYESRSATGKGDGPLVSRISYEARVTKLGSFDVTTGQFEFEQLKSGLTIRSFRENIRPPLNLELLSPDKRFILKGEGEQYYMSRARGDFDFYLVSLVDKKKTLIYKTGTDKFRNYAEITDLPWSPDSKYFVLSLFDKGIWSLLFQKPTYNVYIIERSRLEWRKLTDGDNPYWIKSFPAEFAEGN